MMGFWCRHMLSKEDAMKKLMRLTVLVFAVLMLTSCTRILTHMRNSPTWMSQRTSYEPFESPSDEIKGYDPPRFEEFYRSTLEATLSVADQCRHLMNLHHRNPTQYGFPPCALIQAEHAIRRMEETIRRESVDRERYWPFGSLKASS